jgi:hypothetical protein
VLAELRRIMARVEASTRQKLGTDTGVWIEQFNSSPTLGSVVDETGMFAPPGMMPGGEKSYGQPRIPMMSEEGFPRPGMPAGAEPGMGLPPGMPGEGGIPGMAAPDGGATTALTNEISSVTLVCRAVDVAQGEAKQAIPFALQAELNASPWFNPSNTVLSPQVTPDEATSTFTFGVTLGLKRPLKL